MSTLRGGRRPTCCSARASTIAPDKLLVLALGVGRLISEPLLAPVPEYAATSAKGSTPPSVFVLKSCAVWWDVPGFGPPPPRFAFEFPQRGAPVHFCRVVRVCRRSRRSASIRRRAASTASEDDLSRRRRGQREPQGPPSYAVQRQEARARVGDARAQRKPPEPPAGQAFASAIDGAHRRLAAEDSRPAA